MGLKAERVSANQTPSAEHQFKKTISVFVWWTTSDNRRWKKIRFDIVRIDSIESLSFKLFILERVLFGDVTNLTPITGLRTATGFDLYQLPQVHGHTFKTMDGTKIFYQGRFLKL